MIDNKKLLKLSQPVHITFISSHILKKDMEETKNILKHLIEEGVIEESKYSKDYYVLKTKN